MNTTVALAPKNAAALAEYAALTGHTSAEFLNRYLEDYMVALFEEPKGGDLMGHLVNFKYHTSADVERVTAWTYRLARERGVSGEFKTEIQIREPIASC